MPILGVTKKFDMPDRSPGVPVNFNVSFFGRFSVSFHHYIILFQAREPLEITGGPAGTFPEDMVLIRYI